MKNSVKKISEVFSRPYPLNIGFKRNAVFLAGFSMVIPLYLIIFGPLGLDRTDWPYKNLMLAGIGVVIFTVVSLNFAFMPKLLPKRFNEDKWTVGNEIIWQGWNCLSALFATAFYWAGLLGIKLNLSYFYAYTLNGLLLTLLLMPTCVMANYIRMLKRKLRKADGLNKLLERKQIQRDNGILELVAENDKDRLKVSLENFLYIQSSDNYANIYHQQNGEVKATLLRSSLKNLDQQISIPQIVRCHRSYIVNLAKVHHVSGTAREFTLHLKDAQPVPVSRDAVKQVITVLEDLKR